MNRRQFTMSLLAATSAMAITETAVAQSRPAAGAVPSAEYLTLAMKGGQFLEETARIAYDRTLDVPFLKRFSKAEVVEQVNLSDKLNRSSASIGMVSAGAPRLPIAAGPVPGGPVGAVLTAPVAIAGAGLGAAGSIVGLRALPNMTTDGQKAELIAQLQAMPPGPAFDAKFVQASLMGHEEARMIHASYAQAGDDADLRRIARGALPLIDLHIRQLTRFQAGMPA